jgi:uncharacterized membrane protein
VRTSRLEAFSDAVLAIIITIMVLELRVPSGDDLAALWHAAGVGLLTYLLTFIYVGIYWNNHHHVFQVVTRVGGGVLWANLHLLFWLSLFPFTTAWIDDSRYARTPVVAYGINLLAAAIAYFVLQGAIIRTEGKDSPLAAAVGRDFKGKASPVLYLAGILSGLFIDRNGHVGAWIALGCYIFVAIMWVVPDRRIDRLVREQGAPNR